MRPRSRQCSGSSAPTSRCAGGSFARTVPAATGVASVMRTPGSTWRASAAQAVAASATVDDLTASGAAGCIGVQAASRTAPDNRLKRRMVSRP